MWVYNDSKPIADKLNAKIVGSVKTRGESKHDLDLLVNDYTSNINEILKSMGYELVGSQVVSPKEIRKSRKFGKNFNGWLRNRRFENTQTKKVIEIWNYEKINEDHGMGFGHNVSIPGDENTMNRSTITPLEETSLEYRFTDFKHLGNAAGFKVPTDVHYGNIFLGVIESEEDGYVIKLVKGPKNNIFVQRSPANKFKNKSEAAQMLHKLWKHQRRKE